MECWNCGGEIPDAAKRCLHCEALVDDSVEFGEEDIAFVGEMLDAMPPEVLGQLGAAFQQSETCEDFVNRIMVGNCPRCDSSETSDCDNDPEINDICIGRCFQCGLVWCLDCGQVFQPSQTGCSQCVDDDERHGLFGWDKDV